MTTTISNNNILNISTTKTISKNNGMILIWSRYDYDNYYNYDLESVNNKDITQIIIQPETNKDKKRNFFSGRNLENIITNLQYDPLALSCFVTRELDRIIIIKKKKSHDY